jgi:hypothetical protein
MTLQLGGLAAAWLASAYRLWISFRQPATIWRTSFTVGIVCAALGVTFQSFTPQIDSWTAPSVGSLLNHLIVIAGLASVQVYVSTLRRETPPPGLLRRVLTVALVAEALTVVGWILASPFHSGEAEHFAVYASDVWVSTYFLTFWALIAATMVAVARFCLLEQRDAPPEDRARVVSLALIGLGAVGGVLYALAAAAGAIYIAVTGVLDDGGLMASSRLIGPSVGLLGVGILALLVVPPLDAAIRARRRLRALGPVWEDLRRAVPQVSLTGPERGRLSPATAAERAVIEIRDALNLVHVDAPATPAPEDVAQRLYARLGSDDTARRSARPAAGFLPSSATQREDAEQVYALALAYRRIQQRERRVDASNPAAVPSTPR